MQKYSPLVAAVASAVCALSGAVRAATVTWTGAAGTTAGTYSTGTTSQVAVNYYTWGFGSTNFDTAYNLGDDVIFNQASGTYVISPQRYTFDPGTGTITTGMIPATMTFSGGATYDFTRSSTSAGGSVFNGWTNAFAGVGADSFSSSSLFDSTGASSLTLGSSFTGKVIIRTRSPGFPGSPGTVEVAGGVLEIHDVGALPSGTTINNPSVLLSGGTFAVNIDTGSYTYRQGNTQPAGGNLVGPLSVTANSKLANTSVDVWGRARDTAIWNGNITVDSGVTLTVDTGGGVSMGGSVAGVTMTGTGTIKIGAAAASNAGSNRIRLANNLASGSASLTFDLGTTGILENGRAANSTTNLGGLVGGSGTLLRGSNQTATLTANVSTLAIGAANTSTTFAGIITNGFASSTGSGSPAGVAPAGARQVLLNAISKVGTGTLTLSGQNTYNGSTAVSGGTLKLGSDHAVGDGATNVVVATGGTLDFNGNSQVAGRSFFLTGGSLVNNGASPVTINNGASAGFVTNNTGGSGNWSGAGNTPTVSITGGGGTGATAQAVLQLGWIRFQTADSGNPGSGYVKEPVITFSNPEMPGGRPIKVVVSLTNPTATGGVAVAGINVLDGGYGYTSVPTYTIDNTGTGGSGLSLNFAMTLAGIQVTNAGSGYTSAPTVSLGGGGYVASSGVGLGNFGQVTLQSTSSIGGGGNLTIQPGVTGAGGLVKVGAGTVTLQGVNTYAGGTTITAGTLAIAGTGSLNMTGTSVLQTNAGESNVRGNLTSQAGSTVVLDGTLNINVSGTYDHRAWDLFDLAAGPADGFDAINITGSYVGALTEATPGLWTGTIGLDEWSFDESTGVVFVPEPASLGLVGLIGCGLLSRRRRKA